ncbi:MAG: hypothetical protein ACI84O_001331 [Myxococcota bacterium]|jgi:hypothetical protein
MKTFVLSLLALSCGAHLSAQDLDKKVAPQKEIPTVLEAETDIPFPIYIDLGKKERMHLVGTGVREKYWIDVYGFGVYVEKAAATPVMKAAFAAAKKLDDDDDAEALIDEAMLSVSFNKMMRWVMARDVEGEDIADAFDDSLGPEIEKLYAKDEKKRLKAMKEMAKLRGWFEKTNLLEEDELLFIWRGSKLDSVVNGKSLGIVDNYGVCYAMFKLFLGDDAVDDDAKEAAVEAFMLMVSPEKAVKE